MKVTAVLNAAQGSMEDWNYVNTGPAYYQAVGMGMYGQETFLNTANCKSASSWAPFAIPNPQISLVYKSANRKSTNFLDYSANRKLSQNTTQCKTVSKTVLKVVFLKRLFYSFKAIFVRRNSMYFADLRKFQVGQKT
jgi:hypothetical protein